LSSAALGKVVIRRVPDEMLSAKHLTLDKDLFSGSDVWDFSVLYIVNQLSKEDMTLDQPMSFDAIDQWSY
jgi:hypothetical protein